VPESVVRGFIGQVLAGVKALHALQIAHRDLKPANILMKRVGSGSDCWVLKISDFGTSKQMTSTLLKTKCGTPLYIAPELLKDDTFGMEVDMWSLGVIVYVLLEGEYPCDADKIGIGAFFREIISPTPPSFALPQSRTYSSVCRSFVSGLLTKDPRKRLTPSQALAHEFIARDNAARPPSPPPALRTVSSSSSTLSARSLTELIGTMSLNEAAHGSRPDPLGKLVRRSRDWKWGDQDGGVGGVGTVFKFIRGHNDWISVHWTCGKKNYYRWGADGCYDVEVVGIAASKQIVGCRVKRGPSWKWGNQDGGNGLGVVTGSPRDGVVEVRWYANGHDN
jgi:serine/threonine protein kinase